MADCRVFKRNTGHWVWGLGGTARLMREWVAICATCGEHLTGDRGYGVLRATRKSVKDALHRHMLAKHHSGRA